MSVRHVISNETLNHYKNTRCLNGLSWTWDNVKFKILSPYADYIGSKNNRSCVLQISYNNHVILLTGDIERDAQNILMNRHKKLHAEVLIAPHHGSLTSFSKEWGNRIQPSVVIVSSGYNNMYHLPSPKVVRAYQKIHANVFNTAVDGSVQLSIAADGINNMLTATGYKNYFWQYL